MKEKSIFVYNKRRATLALIGSIIVVVLTFIGLMSRLFDNSSITGYYGTTSYRLFTVDSNMLVGVCALLAIPYQVDGIRTGNYHLPRWNVYMLYVGVSAVAMTFLIATSILAPFGGWYAVLIAGSNLVYHLLNPILAILLFVFIDCDHHIDFRFTFVGMIPVLIYATIYFIMVFIIGNENGGWIDRYQFGVYIPYQLTLVICLLISCGICTGLRVLHNKMHVKEKREITETYHNAVVGHFSNVEEAVIALAADDKTRDLHNNEVTVPRRAITILMEQLPTDKTKEELCELYLHEYLKA